MEPRENTRQWWQGGPNALFKAQISAMETAALESLAAEMSAATADIQAQLEARPRDDEWWPRARLSLGLLARRRKQVRALLAVRNAASFKANSGRRAELIEAARTSLDVGDLRAAVSLVLDLLEGKHAAQ